MTRQLFEPPTSAKQEKPPRVKKVEVKVPTPDAIEESAQKGKLKMILLPIVMVVAMVGMVFMMIRMNRGFNPMMLFFPLMMLGGMLMAGGGMLGAGGKTAGELLDDRKRGTRKIGEAREKALESGQNYHEALQHAYPDPAMLGDVIGSPRMWEVTGGDEERKKRFTAARYGRGRIKPAADIKVPEAPDGEFLDPVPWVQTVAMLHAHSTVANMPLALTLRNYPIIAVGGQREKANGMVRSMLAQLATMHSPEKLRIVVVTDDPDKGPWRSVKWLPHAQHPTLIDALGAKRMLYPDWASFGVDLGTEEDAATMGAVLDYALPFSTDSELNANSRHTVVIVDSAERAKMTDLAIKPLTGVTWILMEPPLSSFDEKTGVVVLTVDEESVVSRADTDLPLEPPKEIAVADYLDDEDFNSLARQLARWEPESYDARQARDERKTGQDWASLVGVEDPGQIDVMSFWQRIKKFDDPRRLKFPIGFAPDGSRIYLNMREASQGGTGPHGEMIGTSGSGKSEFLRCLLLDACLFHSPTMLNLLLVDFKGGATYQGMEDIPHVAAVVTNLEKDETLVDRMMEVIKGELKRRQQIFDAAAARYPSFNIIGLTEYEKARETGLCPELEPMPALLVLIDEYTELLEFKREFTEIFSQIGRVGRSVGVHLLLASQNAEMQRSKGLESNIHYHIALRTGTAGDSRAVIGVPDAKNLPGQPGNGLIKTLHDEDLIRFYAGFTGKPYFAPPPEDPAALTRGGDDNALLPVDVSSVRTFTAAPIALPDVDEEIEVEVEVEHTEEEKAAAPSVFTVVKELLKKAPATPAYRPWLPSLTSTTLDTIAPSLAADKWVPPVPTTPAHLRIPFGLFDDPAKHRQPVWTLDLSGGDGNVMIYGGPQKGKSTAAKTIVCSLALTHTPEQVQFFVVDYAGGGWMQLEDLPHVSRVATRSEEDAINRILTQIKQLRMQREQLFRKYKINSMRDYRAMRATANHPVLQEDPYGDVFILIDGFDAAVTDGGVLEGRVPELEGIASGSLNFGIHIVITTARGTVLRGLAAHMQTLIEGRIASTGTDMSMVNMQRNKEVPDKAGHFITLAPELNGLAALPRADGDVDPDSINDGVAEIVRRVRGHFEGDDATRLLALPEVLPQTQLLSMVPPARSIRERVQIPFGIMETTASPSYVDFGIGGHLIVIGENGSGRSTVIDTIIAGISARFPTQDDAVIALLDPKRAHVGENAPIQKNIALYGAAPIPFLQEFNPKFVEWTSEVSDDAEDFRGIPSAADDRRLATRDWWSGPEIFVIIDDYDVIFKRNESHPIAGTASFMRDGAFRGIHVIVAVSDRELTMRQVNDPILQLLMNEAMPTVALSTDKYSIDIGGVRGQRFPIPGRARFHPGKNQPSDLVQVAWNGVRRDSATDGLSWG